jgi:hypothetical protein
MAHVRMNLLLSFLFWIKQRLPTVRLDSRLLGRLLVCALVEAGMLEDFQGHLSQTCGACYYI